MRAIYIDSFMIGWFRMKNPSGKRIMFFEDSEQFGPSRINLRTEDPEPIPARSWFWNHYEKWVKAGRPVTGQTLISRYGNVFQQCALGGEPDA